MTIVVLVMFLLMVSALFAFALFNISANNASQSLSVSLSSTNYGTLLKQSANLFAKESASRALIVLANYSYNPAYRKGNFISSFGFYASNLMVSGILPNDTSGYPQSAMGNLTLTAYNRSILSRVSFAAQNVIVNETRPVFSQTDPYHLRVTYVENVRINATGSIYQYSIPVNVSIPLNNTPDLFYAQQGILRTLKFASLGNLTSQVGGAYATSGNSVGFAYGTIYNIPSTATSGAACASIPSPFSSAPMSGNIIIATYNAVNLGGCISSYAGLITYLPPTMPAMPYLVYSGAALGIMPSLPSGMKVLLYGPGMDTLNVEGLRNAVMNGQYFASPFTPSYMDRAGANFLNQSPNGIFTFSNYNTQVANFNGQNSYISVANVPSMSSITASVWVKINSAADDDAFVAFTGSGGGQPTFEYWLSGRKLRIGHFGAGADLNTDLILTANVWHHITFIQAVGSTESIYVDGSLIKTIADTTTGTIGGGMDIGQRTTNSFYLNGSMAKCPNLQHRPFSKPSANPLSGRHLRPANLKQQPRRLVAAQRQRQRPFWKQQQRRPDQRGLRFAFQLY